MAVDALKCKECGDAYPLEAKFVCERCFGPLEVAYDFSGLDPQAARQTIESGPQSMWRYHEFLPFEERPASRLATGLSPLVHAPRLGDYLGGLKNVYIKNEASNPTHSFKDRVVSVALVKALDLGYEVIACASTGNLANSVAAHAAAEGIDSYVFIPTDLEEQKVLATGVYGTELVGVKGNYDDVNRLCTELSADAGWAFVNINMRPYYSEGSKTLAYEVVEQLDWNLPDRIVAPIASGSLFTKLSKGFGEWIDVGLTEGSMPVFHGAQAAGCNPVAEAFEQGRDFCKPVKPDTIAKSLAIGNPADGPYALEVARSTAGSIEQVTDDEVRAGIKLLAHTTGIFTETAGGVTVASLKKIADRGEIDPDEVVVVYVTGEGLKTLDAARGTFEKYEIDPTVESFNSLVPVPVEA